MSKLGEAEQLFASFRTSAEKGDIQQAKVGVCADRSVSSSMYTAIQQPPLQQCVVSRDGLIADISKECSPASLRSTAVPCSVAVVMLP